MLSKDNNKALKGRNKMINFSNEDRQKVTPLQGFKLIFLYSTGHFPVL